MFEGHPQSNQNNVALSRDYRSLQRAIIKAGVDRDKAVKNILRLYAAPTLDALPPGVRAAATSLLDQRFGGTWHG